MVLDSGVERHRVLSKWSTSRCPSLSARLCAVRRGVPHRVLCRGVGPHEGVGDGRDEDRPHFSGHALLFRLREFLRRGGHRERADCGPPISIGWSKGVFSVMLPSADNSTRGRDGAFQGRFQGSGGLLNFSADPSKSVFKLRGGCELWKRASCSGSIWRSSASVPSTRPSLPGRLSEFASSSRWRWRYPARAITSPAAMRGYRMNRL